MVGQIGNLAELAKIREADSHAYLKQWVIWLGVGSAAGAIAMLSLAAQSGNPNYAIRFLLPSLWAFAAGVIFAGASIVLLSKKLGAMAEHFVHAHNRAQIEMNISETPEVFASPQRLADEANVARNKLIAEQHAAHARAEKAWGSQTRWSRIWIACVVASSAGFVFGIVWPLIQLSLGRTLLP